MNDTTNAGPVLPELPPLSLDCLAYSPATMRAYAREYAEQVAGPLMEALSECATAVGGRVSPDCSVQFLRQVPREVELVVAKLRERVANLEQQNEGLRQQHGRDSFSLRALCEHRDHIKNERDRLRAESEALLADAERGNFLMRYLSVEEVGDDEIVYAVCVNTEGLEEALAIAKCWRSRSDASIKAAIDAARARGRGERE